MSGARVSGLAVRRDTGKRRNGIAALLGVKVASVLSPVNRVDGGANPEPRAPNPGVGGRWA